jgi:acyl carrier protein
MRIDTGGRERAIRIWCEVLGVAGGDDLESDFFMAGGDSVAGLVLAARIEQEFGVEFRIVDIFENPDLDEIIELIERRS